ncbi:unnamed protein product [Durusdinium trenchii]|uniref:Uncharacterized protein n=1 Tax=Durusdinium trenchii TaxID=1381693 RepID=A0ABP0IDT2_9DINO
MEVNALLKFAKEQADVTLKYEPFESVSNHSDLSKIRLVVMFDASHAALHSQGGHLAILVPEEEEPSYEDENVLQDEAADTGPTSWPSSKPLRTPTAMMIYFTQIKAVTAEPTGDFTQLKPDGLCLAGDEPAEEWSILTYMFLFILFITLIVKLRVAQARNERHFDSALDDQCLFFDRRISQLENDLVKAAEANAETHRHHNEMMEQWRLEQQEAEEIDQSFRQRQALPSRCYRELLDHFDEDCPLTTGTHVTPFGHTFHVRADCHGLKQAHRVDRRPCCAFCNPTPQTPHRVNGLSGTTLQEDMMSWRRDYGNLPYEEWMID